MRFQAGWAGLWGGLRDVFLPPRCFLCGDLTGWGELRGGLCPTCREDLPTWPREHCPRCGRDWPGGLKSTHTCGRCRKKPPPFDRAEAAGRHEGLLRRAVSAFKFRGRTDLARPLAAWMAARLGPPFYPPRADLILPVPLHTRRLRERGYNQALLLARALYRPWPDLVDPGLLTRPIRTRPQVGLSKAARRQNVRGAFALAPGVDLRGLNVILIDDVFTTGATLNECARVLKKNRAGSVGILTLARVEEP